MVRKAKAVGFGGEGGSVEEARSLLAEERGGGRRSVEVFRKVSGNLLPETVLGIVV